MKVIHGVELKPGSYEEVLPDFSSDFPYIASYVALDQHPGRQSPWHWHKEAELFYMVEGAVEYDTPQGKTVFPQGSAGFVNTNVLHMSKVKQGEKKVVSLLHIFDPVLIGGSKGSRIDQKYVLPLTMAPGVGIIGLYPDRPEHGEFLELLRKSFELSEEDFGYETRLRAVLSELWCQLLKIAGPLCHEDERGSRTSEKIKMMMAFIHGHCAEKITVADIAASAFISERECFRTFHDCLKMTPVEYVTDYRIQKACHMLSEGNESVTRISQSCGLGSSSYFGKVFREYIGCSPVEYRLKWQNRNMN